MKHQEVPLSAEVIAHKDEACRLLMIRVSAAEIESETRPPARVAIVLDRSGSMSGGPITVARSAAARLIRSLDKQDRVAAVAFDHIVEQLAPMAAPSEGLAKLVERIEVRGSTNLHGGWLAGSKSVGRGGRVILLSDGHANAGAHVDAEALARQASRAYSKYKVTTTTIGVGVNYDESLMAGMARQGGGSHYFATDVESIMAAFSQERMNIGEIVIEHVTATVAGEERPLGHFWSGETKTIVIPVETDAPVPILVRYTLAGSDEELLLLPAFPTEFGKNDEVTLEYSFSIAAEIEDEVAGVHSSEHAGAVRQRARDLQLSLLNHPLSETTPAQAVIERMDQLIVAMEQLEREYDEGFAVYQRKRGAQYAHNFLESTRAFGLVREDAEILAGLRARSVTEARSIEPDPSALQLASLEQWEKWSALPIDCSRSVTVALENPQDGFLLDEISKAIGKRVRAYRTAVPVATIQAGLLKLGHA